MNEILKLLNALTADELDGVITRAKLIYEKKRKEEAEQAILERERKRLELIEQEKKRQEEILELQRKIKELQSQSVSIPEPVEIIKEESFAAHSSAESAESVQIPVPAPAAAPVAPPAASVVINPPTQPEEKPSQSAAAVSCPYCSQLNPADSLYCLNCGQKIQQKTSPAIKPSEAPKSSAPHIAPQSTPQPAPAPQAPQKPGAEVRYVDTLIKEWTMLPGEKIVKGNHDITLIKPEPTDKMIYILTITNQRLLFSRESTASRNLKRGAAAGAGLLGSLIANRVTEGPKPWLEIPLSAIKDCGLSGRKEYFIEANTIYLLKDKGYDRILPMLIKQAK
ncbi:MAG: hypothetical protein IJC48_05630 [Clostridia bacterium]|nr:hypothetical protein [Clostridia bacterium]MBQ4157661.1 hypothetical protein [Clostridia bacterium]